MPDKVVQFTKEQWDFLSVFHAFDAPVSLDIVGTISPLLPTVFLDTLRQAEELGMLYKNEGGDYLLSPDLPESIRKQFEIINRKERFVFLLDRLKQLELFDSLSPEVHLTLINRSGQGDAAKLEVDLAKQALGSSQHDKAQQFYEKALNSLTTKLAYTSNKHIFITSALEYSDLCFSLGRGFQQGQQYLEKAKAEAAILGDKRSEVMISLHLGRILYLANQRHRAVELMKSAKIVIKQLGDEDINNRAAQFLALYYYMQGRMTEAVAYFEAAIQFAETTESESTSNLVTPIFYGYCSAYLGQFHKAIGYLDSAWRQARRESKQTLSITVRSILGTILLLINKNQDADFHLQGALKEAIESNNGLGRLLAAGGIIYQHYRDGNFEEASRLSFGNYEEATKTGLTRQYSSPWVLEMFLDISQSEYKYHRPIGIIDELKQILEDPSIHLRGVLLRLLAENKTIKGVAKSEHQKLIALALQQTSRQIKKSDRGQEYQLLKQSERYLKMSGDPIQLAKTRIQLARLELNRDNRKEARKLAQKARKGLSGFWEDKFPDGIRALLEESSEKMTRDHSQSVESDDFIQLLSDLVPSLDMDEFLTRIVFTMNRYFSAERGGLFWLGHQNAKTVSLRVARNLRQDEVNAQAFRSSMKLILDCFKDEQPRIVHFGNKSGQGTIRSRKVLLCLPLKSQGKIQGVLYHDNSYMLDCFDFLNESTLDKLSSLLSVHIDRMSMITKQISKVKETSFEGSIIIEQAGNPGILFQSQIMKDVLEQVDQAAVSDTAVLIQGETGVGKELLAQRLHQKSLRHKKPFIIIDPTTIPENLVESELFGHEKGAYTGADRQKRGRIELAHQGTLFIDEIGEIPRSVQAKLLRVLQEKTFTRIGSHQTVASDFRLVAATNRNLAKEVNEGNFREDLFYRINIVPINPPPLRDRPEDILLLARHYLERFTKKYQRPDYKLTPKMESQLTDYPWPGNVRELINVVERSVILAKGDHLELNLSQDSPTQMSDPFADFPSLDEVQRRYLLKVLKKTNGRIAGPGGTADVLGLKPSTLYHRMKKLGMPR